MSDLESEQRQGLVDDIIRREEESRLVSQVTHKIDGSHMMPIPTVVEREPRARVYEQPQSFRPYK